MRQVRGAFLPPVRSARKRRGDLYRAIRAAVLDGTLAAGERLPSSRQAGSDYGVSRGLVEEVFARLTEEGFLQRAVGRGTFVSEQVAKLAPQTQGKTKRPHIPALSRRGILVAGSAACREPATPVPFNAGIADTEEFPWERWRQLEARAQRELGPKGLGFADPRGLLELRTAIARYLAQFRGIRCTANQVVVFNSAQQGLSALGVLLLDREDVVWNEDPCYLGARAAFELSGAKVSPVPVDEEGLCVEKGVRCSPRAHLAYVTPSHQYPTGAVLSLERRIALLKWARRRNAWIIEDDYDGEFSSDGQLLTALYSLDSDGRVLYVGSLNKSMFVSLRLAYVVVPELLVEPLANIRTQLDGFTPATRQMAMGLFMEEGFFSMHLRHMCSVYRTKWSVVLDGLEPLAARGWKWPQRPAGMHLMLRHADGRAVRKVAAASSLKLALLSSYRVSRASDDGLFLRFGGLDSDSLQAGIQKLVAEIRNFGP